MGAALGALAVLITIANVVWGWVRDLEAKNKSDSNVEIITTQNRQLTETLTARVNVIEATSIARATAIEAAHATFREKVASEYVSVEVLRHTEARLLTAISEIGGAIRSVGDRMDRAFDRATHDKT